MVQETELNRTEKNLQGTWTPSQWYTAHVMHRKQKGAFGVHSQHYPEVIKFKF